MPHELGLLEEFLKLPHQKAHELGACGRASILREEAGLQVQDLGAPMDALGFRLSRRPDDPEQTMGRFAAQQIFIMISRGEYWQCGYVIPKGAIEQIRARGFEAFRTNITTIASFVGDRVTELRDWDDVSVLSVRVDRLRRWYRRGFSASATLRTPCLRSAALASTWPFKMRWPPLTRFPKLCAQSSSPSTICGGCNGAGICPRA